MRCWDHAYHQYDEQRYELTYHCESADAFADGALAALGGVKGDACGQFALPLGATPSRVQDYSALVRRTLIPPCRDWQSEA